MVIFLYPEEPDIFFENILDWIDKSNVDRTVVRGSLDNLLEENVFISIKGAGTNVTMAEFESYGENISSVISRGFFSRKGVKISQISHSETTPLQKSLIYDSIFQEMNVLHRFLYEHYSNDINRKKPLNKLMALNAAVNNEMKIPDTIITNNVTELVKFIKKHRLVITKPMWEGVPVQQKNTYFSHVTKIVAVDMVDNDQLQFLPSMFQEYIEKDYEVRVFFINGSFYPMAIFSQGDSKNRVDYRNYSTDKPSRTVPYRLPKSLEKKICAFMRDLGLSSGSLDLIYNSLKGYVFLEVNPNGRVGMVSGPCNYNLESLIADEIIKNEQKRN